MFQNVVEKLFCYRLSLFHHDIMIMITIKLYPHAKAKTKSNKNEKICDSQHHKFSSSRTSCLSGWRFLSSSHLTWQTSQTLHDIYSTHMYVWQILITEWIILHLMLKQWRIFFQLWRIWQFHWELTNQFWSYTSDFCADLWRIVLIWLRTHIKTTRFAWVNEWEIQNAFERQTNYWEMWA